MEQQEAEHMKEVQDQFAQLKYMIDTHSIMKQMKTPTSTSITLGSERLPFLVSNRAYGTLEILENETSIIIVNSDNNTNITTSYALGIIKYSSANAYFLDQSYIYETGAVVLSQSEGDMIAIKPSFSALKEINTTISFTLVNISVVGDKDIQSGFGTYPIQTEYAGYDPLQIINNVSTLYINTSYQNAWYKFINLTLINAGLNYGGYGTDFTIEITDNGVKVNFTDTIIVNLHLTVIRIDAQIAPGWIENIKGT
jgi:hypothetical protein